MPEFLVTDNQAAWTQAAWTNDTAANHLNPPGERVVNVPLLRKTLEHITAHPEEWDQTAWAEETACGTSFCLAGHVVHSQGHELLWRNVSDCCESCADAPAYANHCVVDERRRTIENVAMHELGLSEAQAQILFSANNELDELWRNSHDITNGEIQVPAEFDGASLG